MCLNMWRQMVELRLCIGLFLCHNFNLIHTREGYLLSLQKKIDPISLALHTSVCSRSLNFFPVYLLHHLMSVPCAPQYIY